MRTEIPTPEEWTAEGWRRFLVVLDDMGWGQDELKEFMLPDALAHSKNKQAAGKKIDQWFERESLPSYWRFVIALRFGIDVAYLDGQHDDLIRTADPYGLFMKQREIKALKSG